MIDESDRFVVARSALISIRESVSQQGSSRETDLVLFALFDGRKVKLIRPSRRLWLGGGGDTQRKRWAARNEPISDTWSDENGVTRPMELGDFNQKGEFLPHYTEIPHYSGNVDDALRWKHWLIGDRLMLSLDEKMDDFVPLWTTKMLAEDGSVTGEFESYDCAASIVGCVLESLIHHRHISWWIEVVDDEVPSGTAHKYWDMMWERQHGCSRRDLS